MNSSETTASSPTRVRYFVVALVCAMSVLLYLDRFAVSSVTSSLLAELKMNKEQLGRTTFFAFFFAYALFQIPAGWLSDTFGARRMLALYVVGWSLATMGLSVVNGLAAIFFMRFLLGIMQAGAYPAAASLVKCWIPYGARGLANASIAMGGRAGGLLAFALTPTLTMYAGRSLGWETGAWRVVFAVYGALGLAWATIFVWFYRDSPREHPRCNPAEVDLIETGPHVAATVRRRFDLPIAAMLKSRGVWLTCVISGCANVGWVFLVSWLPQYLIETYGEYVKAHIGDQQVVAGYLTAATGLAGMVGSVLGGLATDLLVRRFGRTWGRRLPGACAGIVVAAIYFTAPHLPNLWWLVGAMVAVSLTIDVGLGALWASYQDIGGRHVASVLGFGNMFGNFSAALFTWLIGRLADQGDWNTVFLISAAAMVIYAVCWLLFDPTQPVVRDDAMGRS